MNAHAQPVMSATVAAKAFLQLELLRRLQTKDAPVSKNALARELGKDLSNMRKTLDALEKDGLIEGLALTPMGERALLAADVAEGRSAASVGVLQISFLKLRPNPLNPRKTFDEASIEELAESIIGAGGILNPLLVFPADAGGVHTIAAGERRFRAVQKLIKMGLWDVDRPLPGLEQEDDPAQAALIGLIENGQREGLNLYDEALAFQALMTAKGCSARECARLIGKSARKVQEGVQVVRQAKTQDVDAFRAGEITWEELRTGVRKPSEAPRSPIAEAPAEVAQSAVSPPRMPAQAAVQLDIEEFAARQAILSPSQYLALLEISHLVASKAEKKATDGPTAKLDRSPNLARPENRDAAKLVAEGFIRLSSQFPHQVTLLPAGVEWLAQRPGQFMQMDWKLRQARLMPGVDPADVDALEKTGRYATEWLNKSQPNLPAPWAPADALLWLEATDAKASQGGVSYYGAKIRGAIPEAQFADLRARNIVARIDGPLSEDGIARLGLAWDADCACEQHFPDFRDGEKRQAYMAALRLELGLPPLGNGVYSTDWLNGPFEPDAGWAARKAQRIEEQVREAEAQAEFAKAREDLRNAFNAFEASVCEMDLDAAAQGVREWLGRSFAPAPWRLERDERRGLHCAAANGNHVSQHDGADTISRRLSVMAVNIVAGIAPNDWAIIQSPTRKDYIKAVSELIFDACQEGEPEVNITRAQASQLANVRLDLRLQRLGIEFGDENYAWDATAAEQEASEILTDLEEALYDGEPDPFDVVAARMDAQVASLAAEEDDADDAS